VRGARLWLAADRRAARARRSRTITDEVTRARKILSHPLGLMLPNHLGRALVAKIDALEAELARRPQPEPLAAPAKVTP